MEDARDTAVERTVQSVTVRRARAADGPAMGRIHVDAHRAAYRSAMPDEHLDSLDPLRRGRWWTRVLEEGGGDGRIVTADGTATALVAEAGGELCGIAAVGPARIVAGAPVTAPGDGEVWMLNVDPDRHGRGVGTALLDAAVRELRAAGHDGVVLWVVDRNTRARRFYERAGWAPDGAAVTSDRGAFVLHEVRYQRAITTA